MANKATAPTSRGCRIAFSTATNATNRTAVLCDNSHGQYEQLTICQMYSGKLQQKQILIINDNENSPDFSQIRVMSNLTQHWMIG